jgi:hypothetical protein
MIAGGFLLSASVMPFMFGPSWLAFSLVGLGLFGVLQSVWRILRARATPTFTPSEAQLLLERGEALSAASRSTLESIASRGR